MWDVSLVFWHAACKKGIRRVGLARRLLPARLVPISLRVACPAVRRACLAFRPS